MKSVLCILLAALTTAAAISNATNADFLDDFMHKFGKEIERITKARLNYKLESDNERCADLINCTHCVDQNSRDFQAACLPKLCRNTVRRVIAEHDSGAITADDYIVTGGCLECLTRKANDRNRQGCTAYCRIRDMERVLKSLLVKTDRNNRYDYDEDFNQNENVKNVFFPYNVNILTDFR